MTNAFADSWFMTQRHLRALWRQPWYIAITLMQPIIWLLLFGALFKSIVDIPGFAARSYVDFLTPGVVVMSALFSGGWSGMGIIDDLDRGVMDRFLASPVSRGALIAGRLAQQAIVIIIQSLIMIGLGALAGAHFPGGAAGIVLLIACATLVGCALASLSNAIALTARKQETLIAFVQFLTLPLTFLSSIFMQQNLTAGWIQRVAPFNPVNWAVEASRGALASSADWSLVLSRASWLLLLALFMAWASTRAFRSYQRSV